MLIDNVNAQAKYGGLVLPDDHNFD